MKIFVINEKAFIITYLCSIVGGINEKISNLDFNNMLYACGM